MVLHCVIRLYLLYLEELGEVCSLILVCEVDTCFHFMTQWWYQPETSWGHKNNTSPPPTQLSKDRSWLVLSRSWGWMVARKLVVFCVPALA